MAKGRLANSELREWKKEAHGYFDLLVEGKKNRDKVSNGRAKLSGYLWLSRCLKIPLERTHIGMFNVRQCKQVVGLCRQYFQGAASFEQIEEAVKERVAKVERYRRSRYALQQN